jgi:hypothetical protein
MKNFILGIAGLLVFLPVLVLAGYDKTLGTDAVGSSYSWDSQSLEKGEKTTRVSVKVMLSDRAKEEIRQKFREYSDLSMVSYCIDRLEIHCIAHMARIIARVWYRGDGTAILHADYRSSGFENVATGGLLGSLVEAVCGEGEKTPPAP